MWRTTEINNLCWLCHLLLLPESVSFSLHNNSTDDNYYILVCFLQGIHVSVHKCILNGKDNDRENVCVSQTPSDKQICFFQCNSALQ